MVRKTIQLLSFVLSLLFIVGVFSGCNTQDGENSTIQASDELLQNDLLSNDNLSAGIDCNNNEYDEVALTVADFMVTYDSLSVLESEATLIVEGIVKSSYVHLHKVNGEAVPYTVYELQVSETLKGELKGKPIIRIAEYGGILTAEQAGLRSRYPNMTEDEANKKILMSFGNTLSKPGDKLLLYLSNASGYQILDLDVPYYMTVGEFHGKFILDESSAYVQDLPHTSKNQKALRVDSTKS